MAEEEYNKGGYESMVWIRDKDGKEYACSVDALKGNIKEKFQMKDITIYNTLKGRLETVTFKFTPENTTWFEDVED